MYGIFMRRGVRLRAVGLMGVIGAFASSAPLQSQAFNYPSLQVPTASTRDYTAALTGGAGTTVLFQWREGWGERRHVQLDVGPAQPAGERR